MKIETEGRQQHGGNKFRDNDGVHKRRGIWNYRTKVDGRWHELSTHAGNYQETR